MVGEFLDKLLPQPIKVGLEARRNKKLAREQQEFGLASKRFQVALKPYEKEVPGDGKAVTLFEKDYWRKKDVSPIMGIESVRISKRRQGGQEVVEVTEIVDCSDRGMLLVDVNIFDFHYYKMTAHEPMKHYEGFAYRRRDLSKTTGFDIYDAVYRAPLDAKPVKSLRSQVNLLNKFSELLEKT